MGRWRGGSPFGGSARCSGRGWIGALALLAIVAWAGEGRTAPTFVSFGTCATGFAPGRMVTGDVNLDGLPDVVVVNTAGTTLSVLRGVGTGGFLPKSDYSVDTKPGDVAIGDLNNDGNPDLVAAFPTMNYINGLIGTGTGAFGAAVRTYTHSYTYAVALGQFEAGGYEDVVVGEAEYGAVDVLRGGGGGTFSWMGYVSLGATPNCVVAQDMNNDGLTDLVVVMTGVNLVRVLVGNGGGGFTPLIAIETGASPAHAAVGDVNRDGLPDVVVANSGSNTISVFLGTGGGSLGARSDFATGLVPKHVSIADLDKDGNPDLAVANSGANSVSVLMGNGDGTFQEKSDALVGTAPMAVVACDTNTDGFLDLVCTNSQDNTVSVLLQQPALPATMTALTAAPNPSVVGQPIVLTASVAPSGVTGLVSFYDGTTRLGESPLEDGTATLEVTSLVYGSHPLVAWFTGSSEYGSSSSATVQQTVELAATVTTVRATSDSAYERLPCSFVATVTPVPPGGGTPAGAVQFTVDGANLGGPVTLAAGSATSRTTDSLTIGDHSVRAVYYPLDTLHYAGSTSEIFVQRVQTSNPRIVRVRDVPNDQGGHVFVTWHCPLDQPGYDIVKGYRVWRRVPAASLAAGSPTGAALMTMRTAGTAAVDSLGPETFWEALAELPAARIVSYGYTAATTQDSIAGSNPYTAFVIQALTANAKEFFGSPADSGYSVDNLSPSVPASFAVVYAGQANTLHWTPSSAPDFREFRLYRGTSATFVPGATNLVAATTDTGFVDAPGEVYYKLVVVDIHGNLSRVLLVSPEGAVATLASLAWVDALADRITLAWTTSVSGGLEATVYRREGIGDWVAIGVIATEGTEYLQFTDENVVAGTRYGYRLGIRDGDHEVFAGEVWVTAEQPQLRLAGVWPNPARGNRLRVNFTLGDGEHATLQLFDVSGRQVASREVGAMGPGRHQVDLSGGARMRPGLYLVRLVHGRDVMVTRVVVLD